jgi:glycosyltransferase involved in cell wall biosynthesis
MKDNIITKTNGNIQRAESLSGQGINRNTETTSDEPEVVSNANHESTLAEVLFISSYPPRECGIATYTEDLIKALDLKFGLSFSLKVCALETGDANYTYKEEVKYILNTSIPSQFTQFAHIINKDDNIKVILIQHEFGLFINQERAFEEFLLKLSKPFVIAFHTVLPNPVLNFKEYVQSIVSNAKSVIVMTHQSSFVLTNDYGIPHEKITVIPHGTHLVAHVDKDYLKEKYGLKDRKVLSTFGLLSSGKGIETTLEALPEVIKIHPDTIFLVIGRTHPGIIRLEGEIYREKLQSMVKDYHLENHVIFINNYLDLPELLEYLQLTDIYLFTSIDPNQAVSGTFAYAMSCACPIISTPIPHAKELLTDDTGIFFDFRNSQQLAEAIIRLLNNESLRKNFGINTLQNIISTVWENSAVAHALLLEKISGKLLTLEYSLPEINFNHLNKLTTDMGMIQFSKINQPDTDSGYTLDDNARALIVYCQHYELTGDQKDVYYINKYLNFINYCQQAKGDFLNYVDKFNRFTSKNFSANLDDANGRALWALGYLTALKGMLPLKITSRAETMMQKALPNIENIHATRAMAFAIKGLYYRCRFGKSHEFMSLLTTLSNRLVQMYKHESTSGWEWFEDSLTYANSAIPEALLCARLLTGKPIYKKIARLSFDFLLSNIFNENGIEVISNKKWYKKGEKAGRFGEQPIDVGYTILALSNFYDTFGDESYYDKMKVAFNWFLGKNRLHQIIYNPCTGGCYDGLEEKHVNLNQGAESSLSYMLARLTIEKYENSAGLINGLNIEQNDKIMRSKEYFVQQDPLYYNYRANHSITGGPYKRGSN